MVSSTITAAPMMPASSPSWLRHDPAARLVASGSDRRYARPERTASGQRLGHGEGFSDLVEPEVPSLIVVPPTEVVQDNVGDLRDLCFE